MIRSKLLAEAGGSKMYIVLQALCRWAALLAQILVVYSIATLSEIALEGYGVDKVLLAKYSVYIVVGALIRFVMDRADVTLSTNVSNKVKKKLRMRIAERILSGDSTVNEPDYGTEESESEKSDSGKLEETESEETVSRNRIVDLFIDGVEKLDSYFGGFLPQFIYMFLAAATVVLVLLTTNIVPAVYVLLSLILIPVVLQMSYVKVGQMVSDILIFVSLAGSMAIALEFFAAEKVNVAGTMMIMLLTWNVFISLRNLSKAAVDAKKSKDIVKAIYIFLGEYEEEEEDDDEDEEAEEETDEESEADGTDDDIELETAQLKAKLGAEIVVNDPANISEEDKEGGFVLDDSDAYEQYPSEVEKEDASDKMTRSDLEDLLAEVREELGIKSKTSSKKKKNKDNENEDDEDELTESMDVLDKRRSGLKQLMNFIKTILTASVILMSFAGVMEILLGVLGVADIEGKNFEPWFYAILFGLAVVLAVLREIGSRVKKANPDGIVRVQTALVVAIFMTVFIGRYSMLSAMIALLGYYLMAILIPYLDARRRKLPLKKIMDIRDNLRGVVEGLFEKAEEEDVLEIISMDESVDQEIEDSQLNKVNYKSDHLKRDMETLKKLGADRRSFAGAAETIITLIVLLIAIWQVGYGALRPIEYLLVMAGVIISSKVLKEL